MGCKDRYNILIGNTPNENIFISVVKHSLDAGFRLHKVVFHSLVFCFFHSR